jgi:ribonuclease-3
MAIYNPFNSKNRLFTKKDISLILEKHNCNFEIKSVELFQMAMVHSSYVKRSEYTSPTGEIASLAPKPSDCLGLFEHSYERLEHLGDSILGACVSTYIMKRFPTENEGFMTDLKKEIVCNEMLGFLSEKIGLDKFYIISRHNEDICDGRSNSKKLGDILEAFIGALWLQSNNFPSVYSFVICLVETYIDIPRILMNNRNFKEQLQKVYQSKYHTTPTYTVLSGSLNSYTVAVLGSDGKQMGTGTAPTKKQAEQLAAKDAISKMDSL